jgi:hypothetical protein
VFIIGLCRREDKNYDGILELLEVILSTETESLRRLWTHLIFRRMSAVSIFLNSNTLINIRVD